MKSVAIIAAMTAAFVWAAPSARALTEAEVLVVANVDSDESKALAQAYMEARKIPKDNLLLVTTTTRYEISREDYEKQIRLPVKQYLSQEKRQDRVRCVCLVYGVPVRIAPMHLPPPAEEMLKVYTAALSKASFRLAEDYQFLTTVGETFPAARAAGLDVPDRLFDPLPSRPIPPTDFSKKLGKALVLLAQKQAELAKIADPAKLRIASRQLMALHRDIGGLKALIAYVQTAKPAGAPDVADIQKQLDLAEKKYTDLQTQPRNPDVAAAELEAADCMMGLTQLHAVAGSKALLLGPSSTDAAVDSELALLWWDDHYNPGGWMPNALNWRNVAQAQEDHLPPTVMTARLDGPSADDVRRIIRNSLAVEKEGLKGNFYIDAGGLQMAYDRHLVGLHKFVRDHTKVPAVLDTKPELFRANSCPEAALYVGWYSPEHYVPCCIWTRGAVGWHITSCEARCLRDPASNDWAVKMIQEGVVATVAGVNEPYLGAFPLPEEFFPLLMTGKYTLAECYWRTTPMASWRLTLIGDPLYNPFHANPPLKLSDLPKDLAPSEK
jgi:uncharacterized protein (TIGR03790 family)